MFPGGIKFRSIIAVVRAAVVTRGLPASAAEYGDERDGCERISPNRCADVAHVVPVSGAFACRSPFAAAAAAAADANADALTPTPQ